MSKTVASGDEVMRPIVAVRVTNDKTGKDRTIYAMLDSGADTDYFRHCGGRIGYLDMGERHDCGDSGPEFE